MFPAREGCASHLGQIGKSKVPTSFYKVSRRHIYEDTYSKTLWIGYSNGLDYFFSCVLILAWLVQLVRILDLHSRGRRFESYTTHQ